MKRTHLLAFGLLAVFGIESSEAQRQPRSKTQVFSNRDGSSLGGNLAPREAPDTILSIDISGVDSWDEFGSQNNDVLSELLGAGAEMTGVGWELSVETVGFSWLSDVTVYFDGSDRDGVGVFVAPAINDDMSGSANYSSGGIVDLGDAGVPNVPILADGYLYIEFWEWYDDVVDAVDATYPTGRYDIAYIAGSPVPTTPRATLMLMAVLLIGTGVWLLKGYSGITSG